jgi:hypothetical protein
MAQLYLQQGYRQLALKVYYELAEARPNDQKLKARIAEIEAADRAAHPDAAVLAKREPPPVERPAAPPCAAVAVDRGATPGGAPESEESPSFDRTPIDSPPSRPSRERGVNRVAGARRAPRRARGHRGASAVDQGFFAHSAGAVRRVLEPLPPGGRARQRTIRVNLRLHRRRSSTRYGSARCIDRCGVRWSDSESGGRPRRVATRRCLQRYAEYSVENPPTHQRQRRASTRDSRTHRSRRKTSRNSAPGSTDLQASENSCHQWTQSQSAWRAGTSALRN